MLFCFLFGDDEVDGGGDDFYGDLVGFEDLAVNAHFCGGLGFEGDLFAPMVDDERFVFWVIEVSAFFIAADKLEELKLCDLANRGDFQQSVVYLGVGGGIEPASAGFAIGKGGKGAGLGEGVAIVDGDLHIDADGTDKTVDQ